MKKFLVNQILGKIFFTILRTKQGVVPGDPGGGGGGSLFHEDKTTPCFVLTVVKKKLSGKIRYFNFHFFKVKVLKCHLVLFIFLFSTSRFYIWR